MPTRRAGRDASHSDPARAARRGVVGARSRRAADGEGHASDRILTAAHNLFATRGFGISLREITESARVNIAAVNYHFGSKERLTEILFGRLSREVNARRLEELDAILGAADRARRPPDLDDVILAFIRPYLEPSDRGRLLARLILQHRAEPSELTQQIIRAHFDPMARRFIEALRLAVPGRGPATFAWRYLFMVSAVVFTMTDGNQGDRLLRLSDGSADPGDATDLRDALFAFLRGGMMAPDRHARRSAVGTASRRRPDASN